MLSGLEPENCIRHLGKEPVIADEVVDQLFDGDWFWLVRLDYWERQFTVNSSRVRIESDKSVLLNTFIIYLKECLSRKK